MPITTNPNAYVLRSKPFGLPFHAAYPITAEVAGASTNKVRRIRPSTTKTWRGIEVIMLPRPGYAAGRRPAGDERDARRPRGAPRAVRRGRRANAGRAAP